MYSIFLASATLLFTVVTTSTINTMADIVAMRIITSLLNMCVSMRARMRSTIEKATKANPMRSAPAITYGVL